MWIYFVVSLLLISGSRADDSSTAEREEYRDFREDIIRIVETKCLKNAADANAFTELWDTANNVRTCILNKIPIPKTPEETANIVCNEGVKLVYKCLENLLNKLEPCLDSKEKYLPDFLLSSLNASIADNCKDGEISDLYLNRVLPRVDIPDANDCNAKLNKLHSRTLPDCFLVILYQNLDKPELVLNKSQLCSDIQTVKDCVVDVVTRQCGEEEASKYAKDYYEPFLAQCNNVVDLD